MRGTRGRRGACGVRMRAVTVTQQGGTVCCVCVHQDPAQQAACIFTAGHSSSLLATFPTNEGEEVRNEVQRGYEVDDADERGCPFPKLATHLLPCPTTHRRTNSLTRAIRQMPVFCSWGTNAIMTCTKHIPPSSCAQRVPPHFKRFMCVVCVACVAGFVAMWCVVLS